MISYYGLPGRTELVYEGKYGCLVLQATIRVLPGAMWLGGCE